jgi:hypothetical protein
MEYLQKYIRQNIKIFACNSDKTPATPKGFYNASVDQEIVEKQFHDPEKMLIGMPTGNGNNIVVIDIDVGKPMENDHGEKILDSSGNEIIDPRTVNEILDELKELGPIPNTCQVETPSGGRHLYFKVPFTKINSGRRYFDKTLPIDIRANGGYVIVPDGKSDYIVYDDIDDLDVENIRDRCAELPSWMENLKKEKTKSDDTSPENVLPPEEIREIRSALTFLSSDDRDQWVRIGMALKSTKSSSAKGLWDEWSQKSDKYNPKDQEKRWRGLKPEDITIASLFHEAKKAGWTTTYEKKDYSSNPIPSDQALPVYVMKHPRQPFPKELLHPKGLVGDIAEYINQKSIKDQPILALGAALAAVGALQGRKIQTETNIRTNIYCLGVGVSGSGKEAARKAIKDLFHCAGCGEMASVEEIASDSSIATYIQKTPSQIFLLDEIGRFLKTTTQASRSPHLFNIVTILLKLYSSSNSIFHGKIYADLDKQVRVENPNLCIYGTTVPESLYKGLVLENVTDGFLSRMLLFESESPDPPKKPRRNLTRRPPDELLEKITKTYNKKTIHIPEGNVDNVINVYPQTVDISDDALSILEGFDDYIRTMRDKMRKENQVDSIYNRTPQIAEQIALILAGGVDIEYPKITEYEITYGVNLTKYLADNMLYITENFIADNDYHHSVKNMLQLIRKSEKITMSQLTRKTQELQARIRNDILETLKSSEQIKEYSEGTGHTKKRIFIAI